MRILIDIGHPAHVHLFKHVAIKLKKKGHTILFSVRKKNVNVALLQSLGFDFEIYGESQKGVFRKLFGLITFNLRLLKIIKNFKPSISISHSSFYLSQICCLLRIPNITLEDTGNAEQVILYRYFTNAILTSSSFHKSYGKKQIKYDAYHELAYLHPNQFVPNKNIFQELGLQEEDKFVLLRFVSWSASHDFGQSGISAENKEILIDTLKSKYKVFISSEDNLPNSLIQYKLNVSPDRIHDVLYYAEFYIGEGASMASESAILGTPAVYVNSMEAGTISEQEKYGLLFHLKNSKDLIKLVKDLMCIDNMKTVFNEKRKSMLLDKIDLSAFLVWFIENWPDSMKIMKENPNYQYNFK